MNIFLSKFLNKIDKKGRVSIPVSYRSALSDDSYNGIVVYPSIKNRCIEACSTRRLLEFSKIIENLDPYSDERDAFETVVLGGAVQVQFDNEGRVTLPSYLMRNNDITNQACFVGKGSVFEIWNPNEFDKHQQIAMEIAQKNRTFLKNIKDNRQGAVAGGDDD